MIRGEKQFSSQQILMWNLKSQNKKKRFSMKQLCISKHFSFIYRSAFKLPYSYRIQIIIKRLCRKLNVIICQSDSKQCTCIWGLFYEIFHVVVVWLINCQSNKGLSNNFGFNNQWIINQPFARINNFFFPKTKHERVSQTRVVYKQPATIF